MRKNSRKRRVVRALSLLGGGSPILLIGGISVVLLICIARAIGLWEGIELHTLDFLLRHRPIEAADERITIVEITEADIQALDTYPVPDDVMVQLLDKLESYKPRVIGLDLFRDLVVIDPAKPIAQSKLAHKALLTRLQTDPKMVVIEKILEPPVSAPDGVPAENVGFADASLDSDGFLRQIFLAQPSDSDPEGYRLSFPLQVATKYLAAEGITPENGIVDPNAVRFGQTELFRMKDNSGGYHRQDTGNNPVVLINFRQHPEPFQQISLSQLLSEEVPAEWIKDRVVLIGMTAESTKDYVNSAALISSSRSGNSAQNPGLVPGVRVQAHAISQILSATLDNRPMIRPWDSQWEYLWIIVSGLMGLGLIHIKRPISTVAVVFLCLGSVPLLVPVGLMLTGVWIPLAPAFLGYVLTGGSVLGYRLYQYEQSRKIRFQARQQILERSYNAIHNGPLQTLKSLIRQVSSQENAQQAASVTMPVSISGNSPGNLSGNLSGNLIEALPGQRLTPTHTLHDWIFELNKIDTELRSIYEFMQREYLQKEVSPQASQIYLTQNYVIDLNEPLHELLHQVYQNKLQESEAYFETIKIKISDFGSMYDQKMTSEIKESILRFFEEALCNIEQHAKEVTRLKVVCKQVGEENVIQVVDNGQAAGRTAVIKSKGGDGSKQANLLAKRLRGRFSRTTVTPKGTMCELIWPINPKTFWNTKSNLLAEFGK